MPSPRARRSSDGSAVLIVDDSPDSRELLAALVGSAGYQTVLAASAEEAFALLGVGRPNGKAHVPPIDVILMDISLPRLDGLAATRRLREREDLLDVPIIVVTGNAEGTALQAAYDAGARDFVPKPVRAAELIARVRSALELRREMVSRRVHAEALSELAERYQQVTDTLRRMACLDPLTGVPNRSHFDALIDTEWRRAHRNGEDLSLLLIDVDHLHGYNERYGHPIGDTCLKQVAAAVRQGLTRPDDFLSRFGGDELVVALARTDQRGALAIGERLRARVEQLDIRHETSPVASCVTVSVGAATAAAGAACTVADLLGAAERGLYQAKATGRNSVHAAPVRSRG